MRQSTFNNKIGLKQHFLVRIFFVNFDVWQVYVLAFFKAYQWNFQEFWILEIVWILWETQSDIFLLVTNDLLFKK